MTDPDLQHMVSLWIRIYEPHQCMSVSQQPPWWHISWQSLTHDTCSAFVPARITTMRERSGACGTPLALVCVPVSSPLIDKLSDAQSAKNQIHRPNATNVLLHKKYELQADLGCQAPCAVYIGL